MATYDLTQAGLNSYTLVAVDPKGNKVDITPLVTAITWSGSLQGAAMMLKVDLAPYPGLGDLVTYGDQLFLYGRRVEDGSTFEIMRGYVFDRERRAGAGGMTLTAYDMLIYLLKNSDDFVYRGVKASYIISTVCKDFGIPTGQLDDTGHYIDKLIARNSSIYDLFVKALVLTRDATGAKFFLRSTGGKVVLERKKANAVTWVLEYGKNILDASHTESIQEMKNRVVVRSHAQDDERSTILAVAEAADLIDAFGLLQQVENGDEDATDKPSAKTIAEEVLRKLGKVTQQAKVTALAANTLLPGDPVILVEATTGLRGTYYIKEMSVSVTPEGATMSMDLAWDDDYQAGTDS